MRPNDDPQDPALTALTELCSTVRLTLAHAEQVLQRAQHIRERRAAGASYREIVSAEERPLIVELLSAMQAELTEAGSRWRRAEAHALHAEGLTMDAVAELFGVTRQRVSSLLKPSPTADGTRRRG